MTFQKGDPSNHFEDKTKSIVALRIGELVLTFKEVSPKEIIFVNQKSIQLINLLSKFLTVLRRILFWTPGVGWKGYMK